MSIQVQWDDDKKVIIQTFEGKWTWEDFHESNAVRIPAMMNEVTHTVHVFSDFAASDVPSMGGALRHAKNVVNVYPDNWGILVIVGGNQAVNILVNMFSAVFKGNIGSKTFTAKNMAEAYALVEKFEMTQ